MEAQVEVKPVCGIIMPIAAMPPKYDASHWIDVRRVIDAAIIKADMTPQIVSDSFEGDVIQRRIINNLYDNPVVVCDVSGLNPNVMFELGMRITFKQPVVIITDDYATIPFDTKVIEHLGYPQDLHIHHTTDFIEKLADRIKRLHEQKKSETFISFIEEFGTFEVLEPTKKIVPAEQLILDKLESIEHRLSRQSAHSDILSLIKPSNLIQRDDTLILILHKRFTEGELRTVIEAVVNATGPANAREEVNDAGRHSILIEFQDVQPDTRKKIENAVNHQLTTDIRKKIAMVEWRSRTTGRIPGWTSSGDGSDKWFRPG